MVSKQEQGAGFCDATKENPAGLGPHGEIRQSRKGNGLACKMVGQQVLAAEILLVR
jgi:hypothetical protein